MASAFGDAELGAEGFSGRRQPTVAAAHVREAAALAPLLPLLDHFARVEQLVVAGESVSPMVAGNGVTGSDDFGLLLLKDGRMVGRDQRAPALGEAHCFSSLHQDTFVMHCSNQHNRGQPLSM